MTITIMTNATITFNAIKPSVSNMSNIRKSVANIQHTRHIRSAIAAILITYDKYPLIIICFSVYELTPNLLKRIGVNSNCQFLSIRGYLLFWAHKNATRCIGEPKQKRCACYNRCHQVYKSPYLFRGLFKLLYEKLDKLVRQC